MGHATYHSQSHENPNHLSVHGVLLLLLPVLLFQAAPLVIQLIEALDAGDRVRFGSTSLHFISARNIG